MRPRKSHPGKGEMEEILRCQDEPLATIQGFFTGAWVAYRIVVSTYHLIAFPLGISGYFSEYVSSLMLSDLMRGFT